MTFVTDINVHRIFGFGLKYLVDNARFKGPNEYILDEKWMKSQKLSPWTAENKTVSVGQKICKKIIA